MQSTRRTFLGGLAATVTAPLILPSHLRAAETKANSRLTMAFIGVGTQGRGLLGGFLGQETQVLAVCDVDQTRREAAQKRVEEYYANRPGAPASATRTPTSARSSIARTSTPSASPPRITGTRSSRWPPCGRARTSTARSR